MAERNEMIQEIDELVDLLEAKLPANPKTPSNAQLADDLEKSMKEYFESLLVAFPFQKIAEIYLKAVGE